METLNFTDLLLVILVPLVISLVPIFYLRPMLVRIVSDLCGHPLRAEFWVRSAALLAALGSLILALIFGMESVRGLIISSLVGSFAAVAFTARAIWRTLTKPVASEVAAP
jgi:hypothetical protein